MEFKPEKSVNAEYNATYYIEKNFQPMFVGIVNDYCKDIADEHCEANRNKSLICESSRSN